MACRRLGIVLGAAAICRSSLNAEPRPFGGDFSAFRAFCIKELAMSLNLNAQAEQKVVGLCHISSLTRDRLLSTKFEYSSSVIGPFRHGPSVGYREHSSGSWLLLCWLVLIITQLPVNGLWLCLLPRIREHGIILSFVCIFQ